MMYNAIKYLDEISYDTDILLKDIPIGIREACFWIMFENKLLTKYCFVESEEGFKKVNYIPERILQTRDQYLQQKVNRRVNIHKKEDQLRIERMAWQYMQDNYEVNKYRGHAPLKKIDL